MVNKKIRVLIIDDSIIFRTMLSKALVERGDIDVIGTAGDAFEAQDKINQLKPDVVTLDVEMPKMNGIDFLRQLLPKQLVAVIVVTSSPINAFEAISAGAVDFIKKPARNDMESFMHELRKMVRIASTARIKVPVSARTAAAPPLTKRIIDIAKTANKVIALGASTGGTEALATIVQGFPVTTPGVIIVQHMPAGFTKMYADRLNKSCNMEVREAKDGDRVQSGLVLIAAGEFHLRLQKDSRGYFITSRRGEKVSGHCPSVDVMFDSVAETAGANAIGAIMTGMGSDGANGLLKMKKAGAFTIGQDKETCVVYGMPMVAYNIGAVMKQVPLQSISGAILDRLR